MEEDDIMSLARRLATGALKRKCDWTSSKKKKQKTDDDDDQDYALPVSWYATTPVDTNFENKRDYRLATYHEIRVHQRPGLAFTEARWLFSQYGLKPGYLVIAYNREHDETYLRGHASKKHGGRDLVGKIQNKVLCRILEINADVKVTPYHEERAGVIKVRTIGETLAVEG